MVREATVNVRDVRAAFAEDYSPAALAGLAVPVTTLVGGHSPEVTKRIAQAITVHVPTSAVVTLAGATHAMTTTHAAAVAEALAGLVPGRP
jgi:pimeloyl-ACP methyl ester carboxylesterase